MTHNFLEELEIPQPPYRMFRPVARLAADPEPGGEPTDEEVMRRYDEAKRAEQARRDQEMAEFVAGSNEQMTTPEEVDASVEQAALDANNRIDAVPTPDVTAKDAAKAEVEKVESWYKGKANDGGRTSEEAAAEFKGEGKPLNSIQEEYESTEAALKRAEAAGNQKEVERLTKQAQQYSDIIEGQAARAVGAQPEAAEPVSPAAPVEAAPAAPVQDAAPATPASPDDTLPPTPLADVAPAAPEVGNDTIYVKPAESSLSEGELRQQKFEEKSPTEKKKQVTRDQTAALKMEASREEQKQAEAQIKAGIEFGAPAEKTPGQLALEALNRYRTLEERGSSKEQIQWAREEYLKANAKWEAARDAARAQRVPPAEASSPAPDVSSERVILPPSPELEAVRAAAERAAASRSEVPPLAAEPAAPAERPQAAPEAPAERVPTTEERLRTENEELRQRIARLEARFAATERGEEGERPPGRAAREEAAPEIGAENQEGEVQPGEAVEDIDRDISEIERMGDTRKVSFWTRIGAYREQAVHGVAVWWNGVGARIARDKLAKQEEKVKRLEADAKAYAESSALGQFLSPLRYRLRILGARRRRDELEARQNYFTDIRNWHDNARTEVLNRMGQQVDLRLKTFERRGERYEELTRRFEERLEELNTEILRIDGLYGAETDPDRKAEYRAMLQELRTQSEAARKRKEDIELRLIQNNEPAIQAGYVKNRYLSRAHRPDVPQAAEAPRATILQTRQRQTGRRFTRRAT